MYLMSTCDDCDHDDDDVKAIMNKWMKMIDISTLDEIITHTCFMSLCSCTLAMVNDVFLIL